MRKAPGQVIKASHKFDRNKVEGSVKVDPRIKDSRHIQRWKDNEAGLERFETKELRDLDVQRAYQDLGHEGLTRQLDISSQDTHMKYERYSFSVIGEGTQSTNQKYREGYTQIDWSK